MFHLHFIPFPSRLKESWGEEGRLGRRGRNVAGGREGGEEDKVKKGRKGRKGRWLVWMDGFMDSSHLDVLLYFHIYVLTSSRDINNHFSL